MTRSRAPAALSVGSLSYNPAASAPPIVGLNRMADQIEEATGGKIKMDVNVGGSMPISSTDITQAVGDNMYSWAPTAFSWATSASAACSGFPFSLPLAKSTIRRQKLCSPTWKRL